MTTKDYAKLFQDLALEMAAMQETHKQFIRVAADYRQRCLAAEQERDLSEKAFVWSQDESRRRLSALEEIAAILIREGLVNELLS